MARTSGGSPYRSLLEAVALLVAAFVIPIVVHAVYHVVLLGLAYATV